MFTFDALLRFCVRTYCSLPASLLLLLLLLLPRLTSSFTSYSASRALSFLSLTLLYMRNIELPAGLLRSTNVEAKAVEHRLSDPTGSRSLASTTSSSSANCSLSVLSHDNGAHLEIAVIESTLMVQDIDKKRQKVWRVLTVRVGYRKI